MIKKLLDKLKRLTTVEEVLPVVEPVDEDSIYTQLRRTLDQLGSVMIDLSSTRIGLGNINTYAPSLNTFISSLVEVNNAIETQTRIGKETFTYREKLYLSFDTFLFVEEDHYTQDVNKRIMVAFDLIEKYYQLMKGSDKVTYGVVEHNHRRMFSYTQTLIEFVQSLIYHFGK